MHRLAASGLASALLFTCTQAWGASADGFSYWGLGLQAQEFGVDLDRSALASDGAAASSIDYAYAFGSRFFAGFQFNNGFALEAGAFGGITPREEVSGNLRLDRRKEFSVDAKIAYTLALSETAFARAHLGTRFYNRQSFVAVAPADAASGWSLEQQQLSTSDMTAGLGAGFSWGPRRAVLLEYEGLQGEDQTLHSLSLSLMFRL